ncbi:AMP-binding protein [Nocardioides carbamazepini]|uniref:AMP-dependent synthetase/ligase n=1 Tax=Nocardioides carbamazepini TaxID=2854259 RepID=UPI002149CAFF|nr:AMP-binding protein [Nocardioides carbamazepini]MCR1785642.1 AMP-binding protein [Nocardioides carbamazepini]
MTHTVMARSQNGLGDDERRQLANVPIGQAIRRRAAITPDDVFMREQQLGVYVERTWAEYVADIDKLACGLLRLGLRPGQSVAIMGDPTYLWMLADAAVISIGAISFGIYTTCSTDEVAHQVSTADAVIFIAENQEYVDKLLTVDDRCGSVRQILVDDTQALFDYEDPRILHLERLLHPESPYTDNERRELATLVESTEPDDVALLVFTSGTTGQSKAAMITHRNFMVGGAYQFCQVFPDMTGPGERPVICHLSLAHAFERIVCLYSPILTTMVVHIGEDIEQLTPTVVQTQPYYFHAVPRIWQKMASRAITNIDRSSHFKRWSYRRAMKVAKRYRELQWSGGRPSPFLGAQYGVARALVFLPMLRKFGLDRTVIGLTAGSHVPEEVQRTWQYWGLNLINGLGMTEVGFVAFQRGRFPKAGSVGQKVPDLDVRVAEDGELQYRGAGVFRGYLHEAERTREAFTSDGWFVSGDVGTLEPDGELVLRDRKKDIMITAGGKNITPSLIENTMKGSPYIGECVLFADGHKYPTALIELDSEVVVDWAESRGIEFTGFTSLTQLPEVVQLVASELERLNQQLARVEQIKKFRILPKELEPEEGDTTPTRKIRRSQFERMFAHLIDEMYADELQEMEQFR